MSYAMRRHSLWSGDVELCGLRIPLAPDIEMPLHAETWTVWKECTTSCVLSRVEVGGWVVSWLDQVELYV